MRVVAELDARLLHFAAPFHVDVLGSVDEDVADRMVFQQKFERTEPERLVQDLLDQAFPFIAIEERLFRIAQVFDDQADFPAKHFSFQFADLGQIELVYELAVDPPFQLVEFISAGRIGRAQGRCGTRHRAYRLFREVPDPIRDRRIPYLGSGLLRDRAVGGAFRQPSPLHICENIAHRKRRPVHPPQSPQSPEHIVRGTIAIDGTEVQLLLRFLPQIFNQPPLGSAAVSASVGRSAPDSSSANATMAWVMAARGACSSSGTPLFRISIMTR